MEPRVWGPHAPTPLPHVLFPSRASPCPSPCSRSFPSNHSLGLPCASPSKNSPHMRLLNCKDQVCLICHWILLITVTKTAGRGAQEGREHGKKHRRGKRKGARREMR